MQRCLLPILIAATLSPTGPGGAQAPAHLVRDLDEGSTNSGFSPSEATRVGGYLYFQAEDLPHGRELWRTDGTRSGTELVKDIRPGPDSSYPVGLTAVADRLFFVASDGVTGEEVWTSDGTAGGTVRVTDLCPPPCELLDNFHRPGVHQIEETAALGNDFFFVHRTGGTNARLRWALWKTDGSPAGTRQLVPLASFPERGIITRLQPVADVLFFRVSAQGAGRNELWRTDGTADGTFPLVELRSIRRRPGQPPVGARLLAPYGNELFFANADDARGVELWKSDGTVGGTGLALDLLPGPGGSDPLALAVFQGLLYVTTLSCHGLACAWKSDGTPEGTQPAPELQPVGGDRVPHLMAAEDRLFFVRQHSLDPFLDELWVSDGSRSGTQRSWVGEYQRLLATLGSKLLFVAYHAEAGEEPWASDGTVSGTAMLRDVHPGPPSSHPQPLGVLDQHAFFRADDGASGFELWRSDGTSARTELLDVTPPTGRSSHPEALAPFGEDLIFVADSGTVLNPSFHIPPTLPSLWRSDGTARGTQMLVDAFLAGRILTPFGDKFFALSAPSNLWLSDGTREGTVVLTNEVPVRAETAMVGERLLFLAGAPAGQPLWRSDGTVAGTYRLMDINPQWKATCPFATCFPPPRFPRSLTPLGDAVLFVALEADSPPSLWHSDGTEAGTLSLRTFANGDRWAGETYPRELVAIPGLVLFVAYEEDAGWGLWRSDGSPEGTVLLRTLSLEGDPPLSHMTRVGRLAYFVVIDPAGATQLWRSDGSREGTGRITDLSFAQGAVSVVDTVGVGDRLFLSVASQATGAELWVSDGTAAGTGLVRDIQPGPGSSSPQSMTEVLLPPQASAPGRGRLEPRLLFAADDGVRGLELWMSQGTADTTFRLDDIARGPRASSPTAITVVGDRVFFAADDGRHGRELFAMNRRDLETQAPCPPGRLCLHRHRFQVDVSWRDFEGRTGVAQAVADRSDDSGLFWFFHRDNWEVLVKVLDGCRLNDHFWVFSAATTNVEFSLNVTDTVTGEVKEYFNPLGTSAAAITDTRAFASCGEVGRGTTAPLGTPVAWTHESSPRGPAPAQTPEPATTACGPDSTGLCLNGARFRVQVEWTDFQGNRGPGRVVPLGTPASGLFWFFRPENWEMLVKVIDGCGLNDRYWVFAAATTNVKYTLRVTDTRNGDFKEYANPLGTASSAITDTAAFTTCP